MQRLRWSRFWIPLLLAVGLAAGTGCDTSFATFEETDRAYSVFGFLDAHADTQFVRVEPLQDSIFVGSGSISARVTSENLDTGETVVWEDRVFEIGANEVPVHNFTTTVALQPEAVYRFTVERDDATSSAEVTLPPAFPAPEVLNPPDFRPSSEPSEAPTLVRVEGVERLGAVQARYDYDACIAPPSGEPVCRSRFTSVSHLADTTRLSDGTLEVEIPWQEDIPEQQGATLDTLRSFEIAVASVSEDWPAYADENAPGGGPEGQPLPPLGTESNIENGAGFLGGIFSRIVAVPIRR